MVNWSEVVCNNKSAVQEFAENRLSFRNFQRKFNGISRSEVNKLNSLDANYRRRLARKALRRRNVRISVAV